MQQPTIVQKSYNWSTNRNGNLVVAIIAHNTVGTDSRSYLSRGGDWPLGLDKRVSIHGLIQKDGTLYRYVPDEIGANHAGFGRMPAPWSNLNPNVCTIGFELENASNGEGRVDPYTGAQLLTMGWEINRIRAKYGKLPIYRHADIDPSRRKDTVGLSVAEIEQWALRAADHFADNSKLLWRVSPRVTVGAIVHAQPTLISPRVGKLTIKDVAFRGVIVPGGVVDRRSNDPKQDFGASAEWVQTSAGFIWRNLLEQI